MAGGARKLPKWQASKSHAKRSAKLAIANIMPYKKYFFRIFFICFSSLG
jgi:hypothetical protein